MSDGTVSAAVDAIDVAATGLIMTVSSVFFLFSFDGVDAVVPIFLFGFAVATDVEITHGYSGRDKCERSLYIIIYFPPFKVPFPINCMFRYYCY